MFGSLFGKRKKKQPSYLTQDPLLGESIRSANVGDFVVIEGFSTTFGDAHFIVEQRNRYDGPVGQWHELICEDGERRVGIEWSDSTGLFISVTEQDEPMGLSIIGLDHDELVRIDEEHSIDNHITYENEQYNYSNSFEVYYFKDGIGEGEGFYMWEFIREDRQKMVSVVKWESTPFEVYTSVVVSPNIVSVFKK